MQRDPARNAYRDPSGSVYSSETEWKVSTLDSSVSSEMGDPAVITLLQVDTNSWPTRARTWPG